MKNNEDKGRIATDKAKNLVTSDPKMTHEVLNIFDNLEKIKNSPIVHDEYYYTIQNLCGAIKTIMRNLFNTLEINSDIGDIADDIRGELYKIETLADIIAEKIIQDDLVAISNAVFHFTKLTQL